MSISKIQIFLNVTCLTLLMEAKTDQPFLPLSFFSNVMLELPQSSAISLRTCCKQLCLFFVPWLKQNRLHLKRVFEDIMGQIVCTNIDDAALEKVKDLLQHAKKVDLYGCYKVTDKSLAYFTNCQVFSLGVPHVNFKLNITDEGLKHLSNCTAIKLVRCQKITDMGLSYLTNCTEIYLEICPLVTNDGLKYLKNCWLVDLSNNMRINVGLQHLTSCKAIILRGCQQITNKELSYLSQCQEIDLTNCQYINDEGLKYLKACRVLDIPYCQGVTKKGLYEHLSDCVVSQEHGQLYVPKTG